MSSRRSLRIVPAPIELAWNDPAENLRRIEAELDRGLSGASEPESQLFVFPELTLTGFVTESPRELLLDGPEVSALRKLASSRKTALAAGFPERNPAAPGRPFNALVLVDAEGEVRAHYRKLHLFTFGAKPETASYSAGSGGVLCEHRGWKLGLSLCFDLRFPALFQVYAREKADAILLPSCWVDGPHKSRQFELLSAAQAVLTQAYFVSVNRSGADPQFKYDGRAYVHGPFGEQVWRGGACELSADRLDQARKLAVRSSDRPSYAIGGPG